MCSYRELPLWQCGVDLAEVIHRSTRDFPWAERLGLTLQLRRLAIAIPLHVAAHYSRRASTFLRGLRRARASDAAVGTSGADCRPTAVLVGRASAGDFPLPGGSSPASAGFS